MEKLRGFWMLREVTIKDVKKRWGKGQEDMCPVTQFEKLWGDMTAITELSCSYINVPRMRGEMLAL